jgi:hypothetical protein
MAEAQDTKQFQQSMHTRTLKNKKKQRKGNQSNKQTNKNHPHTLNIFISRSMFSSKHRIDAMLPQR